MPSPICTTTRGKNIDCMIKMCGSRTNSMSDEEPMASKKSNPKKKLHLKQNLQWSICLHQKKPAVDSLTEKTINQSASKKATASTLDPTKPTEVSNVNVPQKKKQKKNAIIPMLGTCCNPKCKKDLDEDPDDPKVPHPPAVETNVPTYVCNWAQAIVCKFPQLEPLKCQHTDCKFLVHHLCQSAWEQRGGHPDSVACYCCLHHPQYKYQNVFDRSGVLKKSLSSNKGQELSVDLDATIAEQTINVSYSFLMKKTTSSEMCQHQPCPVQKTQLSVISMQVGRI